MVVSWITATWWANFFRNAGKCRDLRLLPLYFKRVGKTEEPHGLLWLGTCWGKPEHGPKCAFSPLGCTNPFAFSGRFWVSSLLPLTLNLLWACSLLFLGSRTHFLQPGFQLWSSDLHPDSAPGGFLNDPWGTGFCGCDQVVPTAGWAGLRGFGDSPAPKKTTLDTALGGPPIRVYFLRLLGERKTTLYFSFCR